MSVRAELRVVKVHPSRLNSKYGGGEPGDIGCSYSADTIALCEGRVSKVRRPFRFGHNDWVSVGGPLGSEAECYRLVTVPEFKRKDVGVVFKYPGPSWVKIGRHKYDRRESPNGWYHGMEVKWNGGSYVLEGPPVMFVAG